MFAHSRIVVWGTNGAGNGQSRQAIALIDPGSDKSLISFNSLPHFLQLKIKHFQNNPSAKNQFNFKIHNNIRICTITGEVKQDCFSLTALVQIGSWHGECDFIVLPHLKNHSVILGADFVRQHQATLDFSAGHEQIRFRPTISNLISCRASRRTTIPPYSVVNIETTLSRMLVNQVVTIEPYDHSKQGFAIANSVNKIDPRGRTLVQVANPSGKAIHVHRGQQLAHASSLSDTTNSPASTSIIDIEEHIKKLNVNEKLDASERDAVLNVVRQFQHVFSWDKSDLGLTNLVEHTIDLTTDNPVKSAPYKTQPAKQKIIDEQVNEMLEQNIIENSKSPFASPVVLAKKKNGEWRFCVDFRSLNNVTVKDAYPLPRMDDTLQALHGNSFFSSLDLLTGFWQIPVDVLDRYKTAFVTRGGLYQFRVMPFGLTNAPATFQRLMDRVLLGLNWRACVVYLDDIIVFGRTLEEHNSNLALVLEQIGKANLKLKPSKCAFAVDEVVYLGHRINKNGVGTDHSKVEAIGRISTPTDRVKLRRFLGACSFYRRFVKNFSQIALPLYKLTSSKVDFVWTDVHQSSFDELKRALTNTPMLVSPNFSLPFRIYCDASKLGGAMGAVLEQDHGVIAYASQHFSPTENRYTINEKEALAILWSSRHFKPYIYGQRVTFFTDHKPLADLKLNRAPEEPLGRLMLKLQGLNYDIRYVRGADNTVADLLSRDVNRPEPADVDVSTNTISVETVDWAALQRADPQLAELIKSVDTKNKTIVSGTPFYQFWSRFRLDGKILKFCNRIVVPAASRKLLMVENHEFHGHEQASNLFHRLNFKFYWPKMADDIKSFVGSCDVCQRTKTRVMDAAEQGHIVDVDELKPLSFWSVDLQGPYHTTRRGKRYIIVAIDYLTKWVEIACLRDATAVSTARFLVDNIILRHGVPEGMTIMSDQGPNFESKLIKELCELYQIKKFRSSPYHPAGNGAVERENRSIKEALRSYTLSSQSNWDEYIPQIAHSRNTTVHRTTGFSPYEMVYGFKLDQPKAIDPKESVSEFVNQLRTIKARISQAATSRIQATRQRQAPIRQENARVRFNFRKGDLVLLTNEATHEGLSKKLEPKRQGPYKIIDIIGTRNYRIKDVKSNFEKVVHHNRLVPYLQA